MTKKHYEAIAAVLKATAPLELWLNKWQQYSKMCEQLADYFQTDNPRFDRARFLAACGLEQPKTCKHGNINFCIPCEQTKKSLNN